MIEHGTVAGYEGGCKTEVGCPGVIACRTVYVRYRGDWTFRGRVDAGMSLAEILGAEAADRQAAAGQVREVRAVLTALNVKPPLGCGCRVVIFDRPGGDVISSVATLGASVLMEALTGCDLHRPQCVEVIR